MHQARTEARAEAEAAAEQQFATALALERAELVKQARSLSCTCGTWPFTGLARLCRDECATDERSLAAHVMHVTAESM